jgi:hypothetical protein
LYSQRAEVIWRSSRVDFAHQPKEGLLEEVSAAASSRVDRYRKLCTLVVVHPEGIDDRPW